MTDKEKLILERYSSGEIYDFDFHRIFPIDIKTNKKYVSQTIEDAIDRSDSKELDIAIDLLFLSNDNIGHIDTLNKLLLNKNHHRHQEITFEIQKAKDPSSIPFIRKALQSNFDYLQYTCSDSDAIAKWFSHALFEIGTKEAIDVIKEFTSSSDIGIRNEMLYRLKKVTNST